ncbi:MAG: glycogen debranching protein GlgX [Cyanobacteria bacterium]|nr:glycogen debranching protein GlgX [Cyanobacteria bacterium GSL.Bin21]
MNLDVWPGKPTPLGATWDGEGVNFAIFSENAAEVELCLFTGQDHEIRLPLKEVHNYVWHGYIPGLQPGQRYNYRVHGDYSPKQGHRFNRKKLLLDPYARAIMGDIGYGEETFAYPWYAEEKDLACSNTDDRYLIPQCVVTNPFFDWEGDQLLQIPWHETIIYEVHVKGLTQQHPKIPKHLRGTYAGLAHPTTIHHFKSLGITAVELLPVHHFLAYPGHLINKGLHNYWGYDSIGYFAPYSGYSAAGSSGEQIKEFKGMVKALHQAGIEVILDVVYNHTGEGNHLGPTVCFRGIDNTAYYRLNEDDPRHYVDFTGCGNSLNVCHPQILKLIMDSLRYWVQEMHVDGFRFDLASALARELHDVNSLAAFFDIIHQDPVLSNVKLIAEPWDVGEGGYQVGNFPLLWSEWNGKYRDTVRDFWRGEDNTLNEFAYRFTGSSDLYQANGKLPHASINFITAHDGFTLRDLVSYNEKHNEANGEDNHDGEDHNRSWNCGAEGETDNPDILQQRSRQQRNFLTTLMLSQGVPMLLGGDEMGRTQHGNNNAYCQDNELTWFNWHLSPENQELLAFTQALIAFRQQHPVFHRRNWFQGRAIHGSEISDIGWYHPDGSCLTEQQWVENYLTKAITVFLNGQELSAPDPRGKRLVDDSFLLFFNSHHEEMGFTLPDALQKWSWQAIIDTNQPQLLSGETVYTAEQTIILNPFSLLVLKGNGSHELASNNSEFSHCQ